MKKQMSRLARMGSVIFVSIKTIYQMDAMYLLLLSLSMLISGILPFLDLYLLRNLINAVYEHNDAKTAICYLAAFLLGVFCLKALKVFVMWHRSIHYINFGHHFDVINSKKTLQISYQRLQDKKTLDMTIRAARGCSAIARVGEFVSDLVSEIVQIAGTLAILIQFCGYYVILLTAASVFCYIIEKLVSQKQYEIEKKCDTLDRKIDYFLKNMLDARTGKELRLFSAFGLFKDKYADAEKELYSVRKNMNMTSLLGSLTNVIVMSGEIILLYWLASEKYGCGMLEIGDISLCIGTVTVFSTAFNAMFHSLVSIGLMDKRIQDFEAYQKIDMEDYKVNGVRKVNGEHDFVLEFKDVSYAYPNSGKEVLHNINLKIRKGDRIAVAGENGAGKTTFVKLLLRLYLPTKGQILLNGIDYLEYDTEEYYKLFSTVFQDFMIFAYTLRENIIFDDEVNTANRKKLNLILDKLELQEKISRLNHKLESYITQEYDMSGINLSGGERQCVAIARAWYKNGSFLVMDEPTSAIDPIAEEKLFQKMSEMIRRRTVILISHRLSSVRLCDRVIFFKEGSITEEGSHESLMADQRDYYHMYQVQAKWYV